MPDMSYGYWGLAEETTAEQSSDINPFELQVGI